VDENDYSLFAIVLLKLTLHCPYLNSLDRNGHQVRVRLRFSLFVLSGMALYFGLPSGRLQSSKSSHWVFYRAQNESFYLRFHH